MFVKDPHFTLCSDTFKPQKHSIKLITTCSYFILAFTYLSPQTSKAFSSVFSILKCYFKWIFTFLIDFHRVYPMTLLKYLLILGNIKTNGVITSSKYRIKYLELFNVSINFYITILSTSTSQIFIGFFGTIKFFFCYFYLIKSEHYYIMIIFFPFLYW